VPEIVCAFAWCDLGEGVFEGVRNSVEGPWLVLSDERLTTDANAIVAPIHPKAMPVILTTPTEVDVWLEGETLDALALQKPLPDDALHIVAKGEKEDGPIL
jgi:putative SOS response-associated peptidase YedK